MEKVVIKRPLKSEGIPPRIEDPVEALAVFEEILKRGVEFYPDRHEAAPRRSRGWRIVPLA